MLPPQGAALMPKAFVRHQQLEDAREGRVLCFAEITQEDEGNWRRAGSREHGVGPPFTACVVLRRDDGCLGRDLYTPHQLDVAGLH